VICDTKNFYPFPGQIFTGKTGTGREINQGERIVKNLIMPYKSASRNVKIVNFFT